MKAVNIIIKVVAALAAVAGVVYVVATYGDKIVAWAKNLLGCNKNCCVDAVEEADIEEPVVEEEIETVEEVVAEEVAPVEEAAADTVVASESDFEG